MIAVFTLQRVLLVTIQTALVPPLEIVVSPLALGPGAGHVGFPVRPRSENGVATQSAEGQTPVSVTRTAHALLEHRLMPQRSLL